MERRQEGMRVQGQEQGGTAVVCGQGRWGWVRECRVGRCLRSCSPAMESAAGLARLECSCGVPAGRHLPHQAAFANLPSRLPTTALIYHRSRRRKMGAGGVLQRGSRNCFPERPKATEACARLSTTGGRRGETSVRCRRWFSQEACTSKIRLSGERYERVKGPQSSLHSLRPT